MQSCTLSKQCFVYIKACLLVESSKEQTTGFLAKMLINDKHLKGCQGSRNCVSHFATYALLLSLLYIDVQLCIHPRRCISPSNVPQEDEEQGERKFLEELTTRKRVCILKSTVYTQENPRCFPFSSSSHLSLRRGKRCQRDTRGSEGTCWHNKKHYGHM